MNPLIRDFRAQLRARFADDRAEMPVSEWICRNTRLRKKPFSFEGYEFQRRITDDMHPNMCVMKPSQVGATELQIRKFAAFLTRNVGVSGIYTMPDDNMQKRISQTRFLPMINGEEVFNLAVDKPVRSVGTVQIGLSFGYMTGNKESDATSINADLLFHDELDLSDQEMIALFQSRLQGSQFRITQSFSTPTFEGYGIDAVFKLSDQHEYLCKCSACNHWNIPEFARSHMEIPGLPDDVEDLVDLSAEQMEMIDIAASRTVCERCRSPLDLDDPGLREWVARYPARRNRGYRVTPFATGRLDPPYILDQLEKYREREAMRRFCNTVLGRSYNDANARISEDQIRAVMRRPQVPEITGRVFIGIDVGITCHIVLYAPPVAFAWLQVPADNLEEEISHLLERYDVVTGCMDRNPYTPLANDIREFSGQRILPTEYATMLTAPPLTFVRDEVKAIDHIRINRTGALDAVQSAIQKRRDVLEGYGPMREQLVAHLRDMVRIEKPDTTAQWQKLGGNDHFFHAFALAKFAVRLREALMLMEDKTFVGEMINTTGLTVTMNGPSDMSMKSRRKNAMSLGKL